MLDHDENKINDSGDSNSDATPPGGCCTLKPKAKKSRRKLVAWLIVGIIAAGFVGVAVDALFIEPHGFKVTEHTITISDLPQEWDGVTIAHLSDIHIGRLSDLDDAREIVNMTNDLRADLIVITGDFVSRADAITPALVEVLRDLRAPMGVYAVIGNHDHWTDAPKMVAMFEAAGIRFLTNKHQILIRNGKPLALGGVDDLMSGNSDVTLAFTGVPNGVPRILLSHNPDYAELMPPGSNVDLMLCGHTHGGQVNIPLVGRLILPIKYPKYAEGLVQGPQCQVFISRGLGMVYIPARFNCRPEIPLITLRAK
ncbi:MAG: metallophosphoesterase [Phycisphaerae bacterium]|nr:metallophosphoesterase [Phycisphaerae bacterium]